MGELEGLCGSALAWGAGRGLPLSPLVYALHTHTLHNKLLPSAFPERMGVVGSAFLQRACYHLCSLLCSSKEKEKAKRKRHGMRQALMSCARRAWHSSLLYLLRHSLPPMLLSWHFAAFLHMHTRKKRGGRDIFSFPDLFPHVFVLCPCETVVGLHTHTATPACRSLLLYFTCLPTTPLPAPCLPCLHIGLLGSPHVFFSPALSALYISSLPTLHVITLMPT